MIYTADLTTVVVLLSGSVISVIVCVCVMCCCFMCLMLTFQEPIVLKMHDKVKKYQDAIASKYSLNLLVELN